MTMDDNTYAIEASRSRDRNNFEDLSSSPPSVEDGFVKFRYRQKEAAQQRERRPSLYDYFTQDGGALMSMIGGKSDNSNTSRPTERKISIGGTLSFDQFGEIDFDDFREVSPRPTQESLVPPIITPTFETLEHTDALENNQVSPSIGDSTIPMEGSLYADECLDSPHLQYAPSPKTSTGRKDSVILDTVASLNINALQFGNENGNSRKRKISGITNSMYTPADINITNQENVDQNITPMHSLNENVNNIGLPNIQTQSSIFDGKTKTLDLNNSHVDGTAKQNEVDGAGDKQLIRKTSMILQNIDTTVAQSAIEPINPESSNVPRPLTTTNAPVPVLERKISTSIMNFFTGVLDKSVTGSSVERAQEVKEIADMNMLFRY